MDPNECWKRLLDALYEGDDGAAGDAAQDLAQWIEREGFLPGGLANALVITPYKVR